MRIIRNGVVAFAAGTAMAAVFAAMHDPAWYSAVACAATSMAVVAVLR